jgi:hypothetical protein
MPQLVVLGLVGAGLYAGYRWLAREVRRAAAAAERERAQSERRAAQTARIPRDLGALVWDDEARVYRPARR